jgi:hypothetical protein
MAAGMTKIAGEEPKPEAELIKARQRERARIMAWLLGGFVFLLFLITVAKIGMGK